MRCAVLTVFAAVAVLFTAGGVSAAARQRPQPQASEEARRAAEEQAEQEMKAIEEAEAQWRAETEKAFEETRQQRADFDKKMEDFADAHSKDAGTRVTYVMRVGDNGLPEGGEVWFVNRGFITHRADGGSCSGAGDCIAAVRPAYRSDIQLEHDVRATEYT